MMIPISVVVPCFNCANTIERAVRSITAQTRLPAEVILVDDGSDDGTVNALVSLRDSCSPEWIKIIHLSRNRGPSVARNAGWDVAKHPFIAFLDADDSWHPRKLELQYAVLEGNASIMLISHRMNVSPMEKSAWPAICEANLRIVPRHWMLFTNPFPTPSVVLRRDLPFRFDERHRRGEDYLLWANIVLSGRQAGKLDQVLGVLHKPAYGSGGLSRDLRAMDCAAAKVLRQLHEEGRFSFAEYVIASVVHRLKRVRRRVLLWLRCVR